MPHISHIARHHQWPITHGHTKMDSHKVVLNPAPLAHPDQLAAVRDSNDPAFLADAVEELLRYVSVFHLGVRRAAKVDIEINGQLIRRHEGVIAASHVANRDPSVFPDPDRLNIHRVGSRNHLAFGYGPHQCLGQSLARVELQIVLGTLCRRIPTLALARPISQLSYRDDFVVYGVDELLVTW
jgi:cytochrome P450